MIKGFHYGREKGPCPAVPCELTNTGLELAGCPCKDVGGGSGEGKVMEDPGGVQKWTTGGWFPAWMGLLEEVVD